MSGYRNYAPWTKPTPPSYATKKDSTPVTSTISNKYGGNFGRNRTDVTKKADDDKPATRIASKIGTYSSNYHRGASTSKDTGGYKSDLNRSKPLLDKSDSSYPPVTFRTLSKTGARSRDPSPVDKSEKSSSSCGISRLYPPSTYSRSVSRERTDSTSSSHSAIGKYTGLSKNLKDDPSTRYKSVSRTASREDVSLVGSQKYISSRFLPKNSIEKSYTAYTRPSTARTHEVSRKNRELLNVLHAQQEYERTSRPASRCSSVTPEDNYLHETASYDIKNTPSLPEIEETESVLVVTRGTSPTPTNNQSTFLRRRRTEIAKVVEKEITRTKRKHCLMVDKEIQSDRLDDSTRSSRYAGACRLSAAPWSSFLDMKFSSPNQKPKSSSDAGPKKEAESPKSISRNSSTKSLSQLSTKSEEKPKDCHRNCAPKKVSQTSKSSDKKQLPPQIPTRESSVRSTTLHSLSSHQNKDFRKSVLNMNPDGTKKKLSRRSNSASSAESEAENTNNSEATDISENLTSCRSYHNSNSKSKLPQNISPVGTRSRRSPSSDLSISTNASSSEDDCKHKLGGHFKETDSEQTSVPLGSGDELSMDKFSKPPHSPKPKADAAEAKSFLVRALAPVTNLFKPRHHASSENLNWMENSNSNSSETTDRSPKSCEKNQLKLNDSPQNKPKCLIRHVESGEIPWWLDDNAEIPEGVETYPNYVREDGTTADGKVIYKIRRNDSTKSCWWLDSSEQSIENSKNSTQLNNKESKFEKIQRKESESTCWWLEPSEKSAEESKNSKTTNIMDSKYQERYQLRHIDSGERAWWISSNENISEMVQAQETPPEKPKYAIRHQESGEKPWWLQSDDPGKLTDEEYENGEAPLGDRRSPEGLEMPKKEEGQNSLYDNVTNLSQKKSPIFISKHTNIDDVLGGSTQLWSPLMEQIFNFQQFQLEEDRKKDQKLNEHKSEVLQNCEETSSVPIHGSYSNIQTNCRKLDDAALQLYKDGDYGSYLDLDASISEQQEEFEGFQSNKKNSIVLRTQLSVRVHTIIEKLLTSEGRDLRRALFSLKQIFQEDKDLVHEFVQNDGLSCLIKVGSEADQNYQNYILRALGQVMLYVDGMNGVMEHNQTIQWLYSLISSKFRLVVKTALKLLLVFVEYTDSNCMLLIKAIQIMDCSQGLLPWHNIMKLLKDFNAADTELLIYASTLINKVLNGIPDQDTYYDQTDALEEQGIEHIIQRYMSKPGTDLDLLQQFQIYEAVLQYEDGEEANGMPIKHLDDSIRKTLRNRKSVNGTSERRKSRRHSTGTAPLNGLNNKNNGLLQTHTNQEDEESSSSNSSGINNSHLNGCYKENNKAFEAGVTPALRRRRERAERQRSFMKEQQESAAFIKSKDENQEDKFDNSNYASSTQQRIPNGNILNRTASRKDLTPLMNAVNKLDPDDSHTKPWILSMMYNKSREDEDDENIEHSEITNENDRDLLLQLKRENTVKDLTQKLANQNMLHSPSEENKVNRIGDMTGLISKAKEGLAKSKSRADVLKSPTSENVTKIEVKKSENELRWEEMVSNMKRPLNLCDMDFTDLGEDEEVDILAPALTANGVPPPPPLLISDLGAPPPPPLGTKAPPPVPNPPVFGGTYQRPQKLIETKIPIKKNKKTVKLFWKEVRDDAITSLKLKTGHIWDELLPVTVDTQKLEHLFESRAKDLISKKQQEMNKNKEIIVLDPKRSNAINIGMTKLPPPRSIKTAILKMDATVMNREGIEKLLTMLPTEEERTKIQEAQAANPDLPLGSAEQFLLTLASISELPARLKLWAFKLDFENTEREIAEPLMDIKQGVEVLKTNKTFKGILSTLLAIGNFLNGNEVKGFQIDYLAKVPEVKDTVHKHSLLHHLCHIVMEQFPDSTDLYSEIGAITRASKVDFDELALNVQRLETDCKASWDHLKLITKHDGSNMMKVKISDFLADCAERIILLGIIHRRIMNRFHKFLLWLGIPLHQIADSKPNEFCRVVSEFALEYRTTRERVIQQIEKKANHRERNKTRGKMITDVGKFRTKEDRADAELRQLLGSDISDVESMQGTLPWRRTRRESNRLFLTSANGNLTDGDDEILESLVKTATKGPSRTAPRERKRTRHADRKSLKRSRTRENNPFGNQDSP